MTKTEKTKTRPFKQFFCDQRDIFKLSAPAVKLWMYHFSREGKDSGSFPSVETLCKDLMMNKASVLKWRKYLVEHDWLDKVGERQGNGKFKVPIFKTKQGTVPETFVDGRSRNRIRNVQRRQGMKVSVTARDETFIPEVEPVKVNTYEVECEPSLFSLFGSDGAFGTSSSVRDTHKESQTAETIHPANKSMNEGTLEPTEPETTSQSMPRSQAGVPRQVPTNYPTDEESSLKELEGAIGTKRLKRYAQLIDGQLQAGRSVDEILNAIGAIETHEKVKTERRAKGDVQYFKAESYYGMDVNDYYFRVYNPAQDCFEFIWKSHERRSVDEVIAELEAEIKAAEQVGQASAEPTAQHPRTYEEYDYKSGKIVTRAFRDKPEKLEHIHPEVLKKVNEALARTCKQCLDTPADPDVDRYKHYCASCWDNAAQYWPENALS